jgi:hypothetical protein
VSGHLLEMSLFGKDHMLKNHSQYGYAVMKWEYDKEGVLTRIISYDRHGYRISDTPVFGDKK